MQTLPPALRAAFVLGIVGSLALASTAGAEADESQASANLSLAVLPIVVHSADDPTYLRDGLADMLASRIDQAGGFEVIRVDDVALATTRLDEAIETALELGADFVLFGSFTRFGTGASLDMQCSSTSPDFDADPLREIFVHSGSIGEVIPDLDDLVGKVGRFAIPGFGVAPDVASAPPEGEAQTPDAAAGAADTASLEARIRALEQAVADLEAAGAVGPSEP